jgi:hypothetical protein
MNWYKTIKIAIPVIEREDFEQSGRNFPNILDIGHETFSTGKPPTGCKEFIWTWKEGSLDIYPAVYSGSSDNSHTKIWGKNVVMFFRGRATVCKNRTAISVFVPPTLATFREIPNQLVSQLYSKFSPNAKLYIFRPQGFER